MEFLWINKEAIEDFEDWTSVWDENDSHSWWHGEVYQTHSIKLVEEKHPQWPMRDVIAEAKKEFEAAGTEFFVQTLLTLRELRPKALWGFYGLPQNFNEPCTRDPKAPSGWVCSYDDPTKGPYYRQLSESQARIWNASTALYPSIYLSPSLSADQNKAYVAAIVAETSRLSQKAEGNPPVFPFIMLWYHDHSRWLSKEDLETTLTTPYEYGACGTVIWGDYKGDNATSYEALWNGVAGPVVRDFINSQCAQKPVPPSHC